MVRIYNKNEGLVHYIIIDLSLLPTRGPCSKYSISDSNNGETITGKVEFQLMGEVFKVLEICLLLNLYVLDSRA